MTQINDIGDFVGGGTGKAGRLGGSLLLVAIILLFGSGMFWASVAEVDEVTRGQGRVVPSQQIQVVQSLEGGIVQRIAVREGQIVEAGDVLIELDRTISGSEFNQVRQQYYGLMAKMHRLIAEVNDTELTFTEEIEQNAPAVMQTERRLFEGRRIELQSEVRVLQGQLYQRQQELSEARVQLRTAERGLQLAQAERALVAPLVERGLEPETSRMHLDRTINEMQGQREAAALAIERLGAAIQETEDRRQALVDRFRSVALSELSETTGRVAELEESMTARQDRVTRSDIRSPVRGAVNRVLVTTVGGVAQPGMPLVEVVPLDDQLLVEAFIRPADIAFLHPGQHATVKLTAYDYARYGSLAGQVETIGADAIKMPDTEETMYAVRVRTEGVLTDAAGEPLEIIPGMVAEIDILAGKRTVLNYLVDPVVKVKDRAFRD